MGQNGGTFSPHFLPVVESFLVSVWLMHGGFLAGWLRMYAADNAAPVHNVDGSFVREWLVLGPIPSKTWKSILAEVGGKRTSGLKDITRQRMELAFLDASIQA